MPHFLVIHQEKRGRRAREHKEHLEEESQPVKAHHATECGYRLTGLTKDQADDHRN